MPHTWTDLGTHRDDWPGMDQLPSYMAFTPMPPTPLTHWFSAAPPSARDLLAALFKFDPRRRLMAADALQHAYFTAPGAVQPAPLDKLPRPIA